ncbi:hypothetical protein SAMN04488003_112110 [Loktanella fryxellensis]|uniref:Uncharacterized protein n=1 Tax=Loktanella fryxellensis TaxID=245187 RepID=A0A1H8FBS7_9RHOB|nr:hypothetical protein SAMN04488003_112110 [Loktanella fryxellensis]
MTAALCWGEAWSGGCLPPLRWRAFTPEDIFDQKKPKEGRGHV